MVTLLFLALFQHSVFSRKVPETKISEKSLKTKITLGIHKFVDKIKLPTYQTSISQPVCPRTFPNDVHAKLNELKSILQNNKETQRCSARSFKNLREDFDMTRFRRQSISCNINTMTDEEKDARADLQPAGINVNHICVKKDGACEIPGRTDANTGTINMCRTCKFLVYLPSE